MKLIKQADLRDILRRRDQLRDLKRAVAQEEDELLKLELLIIGAIDTGQRYEPGPLTAGVQEQPGQRRPKWKEEYAAVAGPAAVDAVIARTEPSAPQRKLVVLECGKAVTP